MKPKNLQALIEGRMREIVDEHGVPSAKEVQEILDALVEQGYMKETSPGEYTLTEDGDKFIRGVVMHKLSTSHKDQGMDTQ